MSTENTTPLTPERLAEIRERLDARTPGHWMFDAQPRARRIVVQPRHYRTNVLISDRLAADHALLSHAPDDLTDLLAEVERLKPFESIVSWRYGDTTTGQTREDMLTRAVEAHHEAFNAWHVKRSPGDSHDRRVAAMRAALDAALGTGEGA